MAKFMLLYRSQVDAAEMMAHATHEQIEAGMKPWLEWFGKWGPAVVDGGNPLGKAVSVAGQGAAPAPSQASGYSFVEASDAAAARAMTDGHPHLAQPGNSIEILEVFPM